MLTNLAGKQGSDEKGGHPVLVSDVSAFRRTRLAAQDSYRPIWNVDHVSTEWAVRLALSARWYRGEPGGEFLNVVIRQVGQQRVAG